MICAGELKGIAILDENTRRIGSAIRAVYIPGEQRIRGILYQSASSLKRLRYLPVSNIVAIGREAVLVKSLAGKHGFRPVKKIGWLENAKTVVYAGRKEMGHLCDFFIDLRGYVKGIEISRGFWDDLITGRDLKTEFGELSFTSITDKHKNNQEE